MGFSWGKTFNLRAGHFETAEVRTPTYLSLLPQFPSLVHVPCLVGRDFFQNVMWVMWDKGRAFLVLRRIRSEDLPNSMVTVVNNMYAWKLVRVSLRHSHQRKRRYLCKLCEVMGVLIIFILVIILQWLWISNHQAVYFKKMKQTNQPTKIPKLSCEDYSFVSTECSQWESWQLDNLHGEKEKIIYLKYPSCWIA